MRQKSSPHADSRALVIRVSTSQSAIESDITDRYVSLSAALPPREYQCMPLRASYRGERYAGTFPDSREIISVGFRARRRQRANTYVPQSRR